MPETSPDPALRCLKCGADSMIPGVQVLDRGESDYRKPTELGLTTKPEAVLFKGEVRSHTTARVCGDCGFVEVYATDPAALWDAYIDRVARDL